MYKGGNAMDHYIPLSVPNLKGNEIKYVTKVLEDEWVSTAGEMIDIFEKDIENYVHVDKACAVQSGTAGLHLALLALGIEKGEEVIVPTLTFIAAVNPVKYVNAEPIFMDCDDSLCIDPIKLKTFFEENCDFDGEVLTNKMTKSRIKAIIVVHVFGNLADMEKIMELAHIYKLKVIEDATEALGTYCQTGKYKGSYAGTIGDIGVYSFNGNKIITTGGGGMVVSNNVTLLEHVKHLSTQAKADTLRFIHDEVGYNYRMTNVQAAMGIAQLEQIETFIESKKRNYELYKKELTTDILSIIDFRSDIRPNYWFYSLNLQKANICYDEIMLMLQKQNIQTRPIWALIHNSNMYQDNECYKIDKAYEYQKSILNLPCSTNLSEKDVMIVIKQIKKILSI